MRSDLRWKFWMIMVLALISVIVLYPPLVAKIQESFGADEAKGLFNGQPIRQGLDLRGGLEVILGPDYRVSTDVLDEVGATLSERIGRVQVSAPATATGQPYDLWLTDGSIPAAGDAGFDNGYVVARPGTARRAITVGAFVTRLCWPARTGATMCYTHREPLGDIAAFSAGGPTRDGRLKPEIAAPGKAIVSALSRDGGSVADRVVPDGVHWALEGTSMAAPHEIGRAHV